eukprot:XP_001708832.1 Hypothetical protein GL50803_39491 [Giardia lamblia ATCC 50803]
MLHYLGALDCPIKWLCITGVADITNIINQRKALRVKTGRRTLVEHSTN